VEKKKKKIGQGGWDFRPSSKRPQRAHLQLVHWWVLIHSSLDGQRRDGGTALFFSTTYVCVYVFYFFHTPKAKTQNLFLLLGMGGEIICKRDR
jgi:hypothetical protein